MLSVEGNYYFSTGTSELKKEHMQNLSIIFNYTSLTSMNSMSSILREQETVKDCFVGVISSHGEEGVVFGADGCAVKLAEIYSYFGGPSMADKSKLFLIQVHFMKTQTNLFYSYSCIRSCSCIRSSKYWWLWWYYIPLQNSLVLLGHVKLKNFAFWIWTLEFWGVSLCLLHGTHQISPCMGV